MLNLSLPTVVQNDGQLHYPSRGLNRLPVFVRLHYDHRPDRGSLDGITDVSGTAELHELGQQQPVELTTTHLYPLLGIVSGGAMPRLLPHPISQSIELGQHWIGIHLDLVKWHNGQ